VKTVRGSALGSRSAAGPAGPPALAKAPAKAIRAGEVKRQDSFARAAVKIKKVAARTVGTGRARGR
jgi:hypothetical protein